MKDEVTFTNQLYAYCSSDPHSLTSFWHHVLDMMPIFSWPSQTYLTIAWPSCIWKAQCPWAVWPGSRWVWNRTFWGAPWCCGGPVLPPLSCSLYFSFFLSHSPSLLCFCQGCVSMAVGVTRREASLARKGLQRGGPLPGLLYSVGDMEGWNETLKYPTCPCWLNTTVCLFIFFLLKYHPLLSGMTMIFSRLYWHS